MPNYFISSGDTIVNFIVADTKEIAEEITGMDAILYEDAPPGMNMGWKLINGLWSDPNPDIIDSTI